MIKKILSVLSFFFLIPLLLVSCGNDELKGIFLVIGDYEIKSSSRYTLEGLEEERVSLNVTEYIDGYTSSDVISYFPDESFRYTIWFNENSRKDNYERVIFVYYKKSKDTYYLKEYDKGLPMTNYPYISNTYTVSGKSVYIVMKYKSITEE